jgi:retron-type reverse transcriptase
MAKTYNNLYPEIYSFENLHAAYLRARRGKRDRIEVQRFELDLEGNLIQLQNELIWGEYKTGNYRRFVVTEPKERIVAALPFRDRVVQHAIVGAIEPLWERRFISDSYACRPGKGTHKGADRAQAMLRKVKREHGNGHVFVLKADIAKYFHSIDHGVMKALLRRRIRCQRTLCLIDGIIDSSATPGDPHPVGLPIGNLTSQLFANVYLHDLDEFVKHGLREKLYMRYMDDFCVVHHDKDHLHRVRVLIEQFLWQRLRLKTNAKTQVFPVGVRHGRAMDFLGYRIWTTHRRIRKSSISRIKRTLRRLQKQYAAGKVLLEKVRQSVVSWVAHASHAETYGLRKRLLSSIPFAKKHGAKDVANNPVCLK